MRTVREAGQRGVRVLAGLFWGLWATLAVVAVVPAWPGSPDSWFGVAMAGFATVGALVASHQPRNSVGWLLLAFALVVASMAAADAYTSSSSQAGHLAVAWFSQWMWYAWLSVILVFLPLVFPEGRLLSRRWRPVVWLGFAALAASIVGAAFRPGRLDDLQSEQNPLAASGTAGRFFTGLETLGNALLLVAAVLTAASLVLRLRRSHGVERQQVKWFAFAGLLTVAGGMMAATAVLLPFGWLEPVGGVGWTVMVLAAVLAVPVATGTAIFRHRLYDIDLVINRTLVYGALTAALAATYIGAVLVLSLVSPLTGGSDLAVALSTLAVAAVFRPARRRIQATVDRRFSRRRYDAARTLDGFATRLRHELDLDAVAVELRATAGAAVHPAHLSLWLRT